MASAFAFAVGYTDVITLLRWKSFATIMTGNALLLGRAVLARDPKVTYQAPHVCTGRGRGKALLPATELGT